MTIIQSIILGLIQGATEFIPVSSSGHLILIPWLLGWESPGLTFTVIVHIGTVSGILIFFYREWLDMITSLLRWIGGLFSPEKRVSIDEDENLRLIMLIILGTIPAAVIGGLFQSFFEEVFQVPLVAALMLLVTAALLFSSERIGKQMRRIPEMIWKDGAIIGLMQVLAIFPGVSRSGATIAAARFRNIRREDAARFSFLLSAPLIIGTGIVLIIELAANGIEPVAVGSLVAGFITALASTYFVIKWLLNYLRTRSTNPFAIYCIVASLISLAVYFFRR
ncbi:MAG: undecaprenyl-diphosphate phosphatase [Anaerolineae bacterium]|nr:undecaprenyl-diphosphate phosphatase [Anaerolineae bacterium]